MYSLFSSNIVSKGHYSVIPKIKFLLFFIIITSSVKITISRFSKKKTELKRILFATWFLRANFKGNRLLQFIVNQMLTETG